MMNLKQWLSFCMVILISVPTIAQRQQGYVKTKGVLLSTGNIRPGERVAGAVIKVKGLPNPAVSKGKEGAFSFMVPANTYQLAGVEKQGYVLDDPELVNHTYTYSAASPLVIVVKDPAEQKKIYDEAYRNLRRRGNEQYRQLEEEISRLRQQNMISKSRQRILQDSIDELRDLFLHQLPGMANAIANTDYDLLDEFTQRITAYIQRGEFNMADSLLRTKNLKKIEEQLVKKGEMVAKINQEYSKEIGNGTTLFYNTHLTKAAEYDNDSAFYYLEACTRIDPNNATWLLKTGIFAQDILSDYEKAKEYYEKALQVASANNNPLELMKVYLDEGVFYCDQNKYQEALGWFQKAQELLPRLEQETQTAYQAKIYERMAVVYSGQLNFKESIVYHRLALQADSILGGMQTEDVGDIFCNMGTLYNKMDNHEESYNCYQRAYMIYSQLMPDDDITIATVYNGMGSAYRHLGQYEQAEEYYKKALDIRMKAYNGRHTSIATVYNNLAVMELERRDYPKAHHYFELTEKMWTDILGESAPILFDLYGNEAALYDAEGKYKEAVSAYAKSLDIAVMHYGKDNFNSRQILPNMYLALAHQAKEDPTEENVAMMRKFTDDKMVVAVVMDGGPAAGKGLAGECELLEYCGWTADDDACVFDSILATGNKPKDMVLRHDGQIDRFHFDSKVGVMWEMRYVTPEERQSLLEQYAQWKKQKKNRKKK